MKIKIASLEEMMNDPGTYYQKGYNGGGRDVLWFTKGANGVWSDLPIFNAEVDGRLMGSYYNVLFNNDTWCIPERFCTIVN